MKHRPTAMLGLLAALLLAGAGTAQVTPKPKPAVGDDIISAVLRNDGVVPGPKPALQPVPATQPIIMGVRIGEHRDRTRFVVEVSDPVEMRTFTLSGPNRVVIDMPVVQWHLEAPPRPTGEGVVRSYRYGLFRPGNSRF